MLIRRCLCVVHTYTLAVVVVVWNHTRTPFHFVVFPSSLSFFVVVRSLLLDSFHFIISLDNDAWTTRDYGDYWVGKRERREWKGRKTEEKFQEKIMGILNERQEIVVVEEFFQLKKTFTRLNSFPDFRSSTNLLSLLWACMMYRFIWGEVQVLLWRVRERNSGSQSGYEDKARD